MKRLLVIIASLGLALIALVPAVLAADRTGPSDHVLISIQGDITLPAGEQVDLVIVIGGTTTVFGDATTVIAIDGRAVFSGGTTQHVLAIASPVEIGAGATVTGDVTTLDSSTVAVAPGAAFGGTVQDLAPRLAGIGAILAPAIFLLFVGVFIVNLVAGLALSALGARQVRAAEALISREPGAVLVAGLAGVLLPMILVVGLFVSVVGAPLGIAILVTVWPLVTYLGYLIAGIWIGDWVLGRTSAGATTRERPYAASVVGLVVLQVLFIVPPISAIASLFGLGAVLLLAWRVIRGETASSVPAMSGPSTAPVPG
ncbi:hypothetical protein BH20CHL7_BH20CHL7_11900 [soil metagenome]